MRRFLLLLSLLALPAFAQEDDEPVVSNIPFTIPTAAAPGATTELTFFGVSGTPQSLWTSLPGVTASDLATDARKIHCKLTVPKDTPVGVAAARLLTSAGAGPLQLFMIDDLPSVVRKGKNTSPAAAQPIEFPCAVDGAVDRAAADYYRVPLKKGQRVSIEAVAMRLGSKLDPVLRLLDPAGHELAYADDAPGANGDARFSVTIPADGEYLIELRDASYDGGGDYRYHLRVGDFPIAIAAFPPVWKRGATTRCAIEGTELAQKIEPIDVLFPSDTGRRSVSFKYPGGQSSGFVSVFAVPSDEIAPSKKQLTSQDPLKLSIPAAVTGRFTKPGSRDFYAFPAQKGDKYLFHMKTRMLNSPCDPMVRVFKPDGSTVLASLKPTSVVVADERKGPPPPPPVDDETLEVQIPEDGVYKFSVEDLNRGGGPGMVYHIDIERSKPSFALLVDTDKVDAANGSFKVKVKAVRAGYTGPITLTLQGIDGAELKGNTIEAGKTDGEIEAKLPAHTAGLLNIRVIGHAKDSDSTAMASTRMALRRLFPRLVAPADLDGLIAVGVRSEAK